jgi:protein gp37
MAENSKIEWCDHTFNPWTGCTKVSPGCANCYAESWSKRSGIVTWGKGQPRRRTSEGNWKQPLKWNHDAAREWQSWTAAVEAGADAGKMPRRPRVFCSSLADWLDDEVPIEWLIDLLELIRTTPNLDWLLLTKRPQNWSKRLAGATVRMLRNIGEKSDEYTDEAYCFIAQWLRRKVLHDNVWIGTTVEDQQRADERIPLLLEIPAKVRFLSCEPLLSFTDIQQVGDDNLTIYWPLVGKAISDGMNEPLNLKYGGIDWVIAGGESGPGARPMHPEWARALRDQCASAGVPFLFKQWGEWEPYQQGNLSYMERFKETRILGNGPGATGWPMYLVGKKAAGRILDDVEHNGFPQP